MLTIFLNPNILPISGKKKYYYLNLLPFPNERKPSHFSGKGKSATK